MAELNKEDNDEISLIDLFAVLWHRKKMIIIITLIGAVGSVVFSIISLVLPSEISPLPNLYTSEATMLISDSSSQNNGLTAAISASGLGGLAGLAGINVGTTFGQLAIHMVGSNFLLDAVVDEFDLITRYKIDIDKSPRTESRKALRSSLEAAIDDKSGVFTIRFTDKDPAFAQSIVNFCVLFLEQRFSDLGLDTKKLEERNLDENIRNTFREIQNLEVEAQRLGNSVNMAMGGYIPAITLEVSRLEMELETYRKIYTQLRVQHEVLKVNLASERPIFQILEMAEIPDQKSKPGRGLLCIIVTFASGFFAVFLAFVLNAIDNIRKDPEAMAKLQGIRSKNMSHN